MNENGFSVYRDSKGNILAYCIRRSFRSKGIKFLSEDDHYFQTAYMSHKKGHIIQSHYHNRIERVVNITSEAIVMKRGKILVTLFEEKKPITEFEISRGDVLVLLNGGHGFKILKDTDMIEIKQGPYLGERDKTRF